MTAKELLVLLEPYIDRAGHRLHLPGCKAFNHHQIEGTYRAYDPPDYKVPTPCSCGFDDLIARAKGEPE